MTRPWLTGLIFCLVCKAPAQTSDAHLQRGLDSMRQQQYAAALPELELARQAHPNVPEIENFLGITTTQLGQIADADAHYRRAIALNPKLPGPHKNLGFNQLNEKAYPSAERELKTALSLDPHDQFTHYYLASLYLATARDAEAVSELNASQRLLANDPEAEFLMAKACLNTGATPQALALIQALADQLELTLARNYELALLLTSKQLYPEAVQRFEYALAGQPQSWIAKYDLAIAHLNAGHADKALLILQPLALEQPGNPDVLSSLGSAYEAADQLPEALEAYQNAVRADPQNADRYLDYTRLLMDLDRNEEAMQIVEAGIQGAQDPYALDIRLGVLRIKQARYDDARIALNEAIALHPEIAVAYVALAQSFMQQGSDDKAIEPLLKGRAILPQDATLEYYFGLVSLRLGHIAEAEAALGNAARLRPEVIEPHAQLGKLYLQTNRLIEAKSEFEKVIALAPSNSNAHFQLSKIYARLGDTRKSTQMADETRHLMQSQREAAVRLQKGRFSAFQPTPN